jgi:glutathione synthase/RimK-type ligase-like ATP-grasp enzyme
VDGESLEQRPGAGAIIGGRPVPPGSSKEMTMRIGVLRGRENSFPEAFIAKVNSTPGGAAAEFVQLGGTKLNEPVPYRVILDRMSHEVPYYAVYLKMAALQGTYCINNTFWRSADDKFFGYAAAEKLGIAEPKTVVLPNKEYVEDVTSDSLRNLWPTDFQMYADYVGLPCIMKPAFGGGWKDVHRITSLEQLLHVYNGSREKTMMLQELIVWDTYVRVPTIGRRWARAIRYDPAPGGMGGYNQDYDILPSQIRDQAEELSLRFNRALGYDMNALEFAVKDGRFYGIDLTNHTPDLDYRSLKDAHFPWAVEKMAEFAVEKALSGEPTPSVPDWRALLLH